MSLARATVQLQFVLAVRLPPFNLRYDVPQLGQRLRIANMVPWFFVKAAISRVVPSFEEIHGDLQAKAVTFRKVASLVVQSAFLTLGCHLLILSLQRQRTMLLLPKYARNPVLLQAQPVTRRAWSSVKSLVLL